MDVTSTHSSIADVLHAITQALLVPDIVLLLLFAGYALFCIGSILMEYFTERRNFKVAMPQFLSALMGAKEGDIPEVIRASGLLNRQKSALLTVFDYRTLPGDALLALIRRTVNNEETHYGKITGRNNTAAKISPMLGLMGTLIPLGPGIVALGKADPALLSSSLLIAFDTTVAGLAVAAVCLAVGKIRSTWYADYLSALDSGMATILQKIEDMRSAGAITAAEPSNYAFLFEEGLKKDKTAAQTSHNQAAAAAPASAPAPATPSAAGAATSPALAPAASPTGSAAPTAARTPSTAPAPTPEPATAPAPAPTPTPGATSPTPRVSSALQARVQDDGTGTLPPRQDG